MNKQLKKNERLVKYDKQKRQRRCKKRCLNHSRNVLIACNNSFIFNTNELLEKIFSKRAKNSGKEEC